MAINNIVLNDAQATPVAHTFVPIGKDASGVLWWEDQTGAAQIGYNRISMQLVRPAVARVGDSSQERVNRLKVNVYTPKTEVLGNTSTGLTPAPTVAYVPTAKIELILSERTLLQDRKDLRKYVDFLLAESQVTAAAESLILPF